MKLLSIIALLTGLSSAADLSVWDFDESCEQYRDAIQKAYNDAEYMAVKAQEDLLKLLDPRPTYSKGTARRVREWDRIARAVTNVFGFVPSKDGSKMDDEYYSNVMCRLIPYFLQESSWLDYETNIPADVFNRMTTTLRDGKMVPENGYGGRKPLMVCDRDKFTWVGADDKDPTDPENRPLKVSRAKDFKPDDIGAWTYKNRYIGTKTQGRALNRCDPGEWAVTNTRLDFIIICPLSFGNDVAQTPSAVDVKDNEMVKGDDLDKYATTSLSRILIHEFAHWFGGGETGGLDHRNGKFYLHPSHMLHYI